MDSRQRRIKIEELGRINDNTDIGMARKMGMKLTDGQKAMQENRKMKKRIEELEQRSESHPQETIVMWRDADTPPDGNKDKWSRKVIAVTNYGNVYSLCYYHGINGGNWQRRVVFEDGEKVLKWTDFPDT